MERETSADYATLLGTMKRAVEEVSGQLFQPHVVMGNCAEAVSVAVTEVFPQAERAFCWFHVKKAIETQLRKEGREMQEICKADLASLQLCYSTAQFEVAAALMLAKWEQHH